MTAALVTEVGPPLAALLIGLGWLFGHRAGVQRERERCDSRTIAMKELQRRIEEAAR